MGTRTRSEAVRIERKQIGVIEKVILIALVSNSLDMQGESEKFQDSSLDNDSTTNRDSECKEEAGLECGKQSQFEVCVMFMWHYPVGCVRSMIRKEIISESIDLGVMSI